MHLHPWLQDSEVPGQPCDFTMHAPKPTRNWCRDLVSYVAVLMCAQLCQKCTLVQQAQLRATVVQAGSFSTAL